MIKLIPKEERKNCHCWYCGTDKSVKYEVQFVNPNDQSGTGYTTVVICNKCALNHAFDLPSEEED